MHITLNLKSIWPSRGQTPIFDTSRLHPWLSMLYSMHLTLSFDMIRYKCITTFTTCSSTSLLVTQVNSVSIIRRRQVVSAVTIHRGQVPQQVRSDTRCRVWLSGVPVQRQSCQSHGLGHRRSGDLQVYYSFILPRVSIQLIKSHYRTTRLWHH
jgi:hypothetical protein